MQEELKDNILMIHPEGNIYNNPHLSGLVDILSENGYSVDIFSERRLYNQNLKSTPFNLIFRDQIERLKKNYSFIIGVDLGIIEGSVLSLVLERPLIYISYEIFFEDEIGKEVKDIERAACKVIDFAICQDRLRSNLLSKENKIPLDKIIQMPVAGRFFHDKKKSYFLHEKLGISTEKKIALMTGSLSAFTCTWEIIRSVEKWPPNWILVLHGRYGPDANIEKVVSKQNKANKKIFLSELQTETTDELTPILHSSDIGIAFYNATGENFYTGKNISNIGWASGKIGTYLQNGLPIISNVNGEIGEFIGNNNLGAIVKSIDEIPSILHSINDQSINFASQTNFKTLFEEYLSVNKSSKELLSLLKNGSFQSNPEKEKKQENLLEIINSDTLLHFLWEIGKTKAAHQKPSRPNFLHKIKLFLTNWH
jgi:hypothetical protein